MGVDVHFINYLVLVLISSMTMQSATSAADLDKKDGIKVHHHTVESGDTLWDLSEKYLGNPLSYTGIKKINKIDNERLLQPGQELSFISARFYPGIVTAVTGQAHLVQGTEKNQVRKGALIHEGSLIQAMEQSFVKLQFMNQVEVEISPNSTVLFHTAANNTRTLAPRFELQKGGAEVQVPAVESDYNKLEVMTPHLTLGVRGTHFRVKHDANTMANEVLAGKVVLTKQHKQLAQVSAGEGAVFSARTHAIAHEKLAAKPSVGQVVYDQQGLHLTVKPQHNAAAYKVKAYSDADYSVPLQEFISRQPSFVIPAQFVADGTYYLSVTTMSLNGLESYPQVYQHALDQISVVALERGIEFTFPYCTTQWRVQVAETERFLIPAIDKTAKNTCKMVINNLPSIDWYWRVFEGGNNDMDIAKGQVKVLGGK